MFTSKDFETLHQFKIKNGFTCLDTEEITNQYFFCRDTRMIFIKKSRRFYKVMASCQCGFEPLYREFCLDVVFHSTDLNECINMFLGYCLRLIK